MVHKLVPAAAATLAVFLTQALPAAACGGLIAPNGAIRLERATTLVAWHDGVERYMTSFSYNGEATSFGWIVPLPAVPDKVEEGGGWTLQRLNREKGITVVLITHEMDIAEYGTRIVSFRDGVVVADKAVARRRLAHDELAALPPPVAATAV